MGNSADAYDQLFDDAGRQNNLDPRLLKSIFFTESGGNPNTQPSESGAQGGMQLMPATAAAMGAKDTSMQQQVPAAARVLAQGMAIDGTPETALKYYFAGPNRAGWGPKTAQYPLTVAKHYAAPYTAVNAQAPTEAPAVASDTPKSGADILDALTAEPDSASAVVAKLRQQLAPPPDQTTSAPMAGADILKSLTADPAAPPPPVASAATPASPAVADAEPPTIMDKIGAGLNRAAHDMTDVPAEYLAKGADAIGLTGLLNRMGVTAPTAPQTAAADTASRQAYDQNYGDSNIASGARIGGQVAATLPILASGGGILGAAGDVAAAGAGRIAPWAGRAVDGVNALLGGEFGTGVAARGLSLAANGALQGGAAGALTAGQSDQPVGSQILSGAETGMVAGPLAGVAGAALRGAGGLISGTGGGASPDVARLAQLARDTYGIPITAPQMSENSLLRTANDQSSKLPFSGAGGIAEAQQTAFNRAVGRTFGEDSERITPEVMQRAAGRIGGVMNDVANRTHIAIDAPLMDDLSRIEQESASSPLGHGGQDAIRAQIDNILGAGGNGTIDGQAYQQLTRAGAPLQRAQQAADPNVRYYAGQVRDALDNAFQRSASPADQAALGQARGQYRAMKTVEDLAEKSTDGNISPALLMGQVRGASSRFDGSTSGMAYTGGGQLGDLARIGQQFLKAQPNSGTPDRMLVNSLLGGGSVAAGIANPLAAAAVPAGLLANRLAGAYLRSGGYANRVINSSINPATNRLIPTMVIHAAPTSAVVRNALTQQ